MLRKCFVCTDKAECRCAICKVSLCKACSFQVGCAWTTTDRACYLCYRILPTQQYCPYEECQCENQSPNTMQRRRAHRAVVTVELTGVKLPWGRYIHETVESVWQRDAEYVRKLAMGIVEDGVKKRKLSADELCRSEPAYTVHDCSVSHCTHDYHFLNTLSHSDISSCIRDARTIMHHTTLLDTFNMLLEHVSLVRRPFFDELPLDLQLFLRENIMYYNLILVEHEIQHKEASLSRAAQWPEEKFTHGVWMKDNQVVWTNAQ